MDIPPHLKKENGCHATTARCDRGMKAINEQMICAEGKEVWTINSGKVKCPVCGRFLEPDSEYPNDLLCGHCEKAFDKTTLEEIQWNP